jgi:hypothetical protein
MKLEREQLATGQMVHKQIAHTAKGICEAVFEAMSHNDRFHAQWPEKTRKRFIQRYWADYIGHARTALTAMLQPIPGTECDPDGPKYATPQIMRDEIFEALLIDGQYKRPAPLDNHQLRANAGFEPLSDVLKSKHGRLLN